MLNYESFQLRIARSNTLDKLHKLVHRITKFYELGLITADDLANLDSKIMIKIAKIESK